MIKFGDFGENMLPNPILNWTGWILRNTHAEIDGLSYEDGPEWISKMWEVWVKNSEYGQSLNTTWEIKKIENS